MGLDPEKEQWCLRSGSGVNLNCMPDVLYNLCSVLNPETEQCGAVLMLPRLHVVDCECDPETEQGVWETVLVTHLHLMRWIVSVTQRRSKESGRLFLCYSRASHAAECECDVPEAEQ